MDHDVGQMRRAAVHAEELTIEHVRQPRQRVPVRGVAGDESPHESSTSQSIANVRVVGDVVWIVVVEKCEVANLEINRDREGK